MKELIVKLKVPDWYSWKDFQALVEEGCKETVALKERNPPKSQEMKISHFWNSDTEPEAEIWIEENG